MPGFKSRTSGIEIDKSASLHYIHCCCCCCWCYCCCCACWWCCCYWCWCCCCCYCWCCCCCCCWCCCSCCCCCCCCCSCCCCCCCWCCCCCCCCSACWCWWCCGIVMVGGQWEQWVVEQRVTKIDSSRRDWFAKTKTDYNMESKQINKELRGSSGLVVMREDSCSRGREFVY